MCFVRRTGEGKTSYYYYYYHYYYYYDDDGDDDEFIINWILWLSSLLRYFTLRFDICTKVEGAASLHLGIFGMKAWHYCLAFPTKV